MGMKIKSIAGKKKPTPFQQQKWNVLTTIRILPKKKNQFPNLESKKTCTST